METHNYQIIINRRIQLSSGIYITIFAYRFTPGFWDKPEPDQSRLFDRMNEFFSSSRKKLVHLRTYRSIRHDCDLIVWCSSKSPENLVEFRENLNRVLGSDGYPDFSMFSLYEHSPYLKKGQELGDSLNFPPKKYFVSYPMNKDPEWYLVDSKERKEIMSEHISMATSSPENEDIRSYTTYSYGIADQEFVVMYETDSLSNWSHVTAKLREARQRKWVTKEYPIYVGILSEPFRF